MSSEYLRVPYGMTVHGPEEIAAVVKVMETSTQMGKHVAEFEARVAELFGKQYGIMVNSGSSALLLAWELLRLPPGSEVITPALNFATTVGSIVKAGLTPALVDVEPDTFCVDIDQMEDLVTSQTRAICIPNLLGNVPNWERLARFAAKHGLKVVEDSCDTLGATFAGRPTGEFSDISVSSFYGSHVINCLGNGGILCVNNEEYARRARLLRSWGRSSSLLADSESIDDRLGITLDEIPYDAKFVFGEVGYNFEPNEAGAAFGLVQLGKLSQFIAARRRNFAAHIEFFGQYDQWFVLPRQLPEVETAWLAFPLIVKPEAPFTRAALQKFWEGRNIQTRVIFTGNVLRQPGFRGIPRRESPVGYPDADQVMRGGVLIGCHQGLTAPMLEHIQTSFNEFAAGLK